MSEESKPTGASTADRSPSFTPEPGATSATLTRLLAVVVIAVLAVTTILLCVNIFFQYHNYAGAVTAALSAKPEPNHSGALSYSRAWDFAVIKTSSLFLGFLLIFTGALYVLRSADHAFALEVRGAEGSGRLSTSSPGLVMVTLGVILVALVLYKDSIVSYREPTVPETVSVKEGEMQTNMSNIGESK